MKAKPSIIVVPTYNEVENIANLMGRLRAVAREVDVLVVDDNSPDGTADAVKKLGRTDHGVHLVTRSRKQGLAGAYIEGFAWALSRGYQRILQMDANISHRPQYLPSILALLEECDVVVGSRYIDGGGTRGWSRVRELISRGGNHYARGVLGLPYRDLTGGFNAWRGDVLQAIDFSSIRSRGYAFQVELKYRAHRRGYRIRETPIVFDDRELGSSKMSGPIVWEAAFRVLQMRRSPAS